MHEMFTIVFFKNFAYIRVYIYSTVSKEIPKMDNTSTECSILHVQDTTKVLNNLLSSSNEAGWKDLQKVFHELLCDMYVCCYYAVCADVTWGQPNVGTKLRRFRKNSCSNFKQ